MATDGAFRFDGVPPGTYLLIVEIPSVGQSSESVTVSAGQETPVELEIDHIAHFDEIVVTATGDLRSESELSNAVSVLSGADLQLRMGATLGETLEGEPGVSSTSFVPGAGRPIIRGLSGARVRVMAGGIGTGDVSAVSADHAVTSDPAAGGADRGTAPALRRSATAPAPSAAPSTSSTGAFQPRARPRR